jgi:hypothetical protein
MQYVFISFNLENILMILRFKQKNKFINFLNLAINGAKSLLTKIMTKIFLFLTFLKFNKSKYCLDLKIINQSKSN